MSPDTQTANRVLGLLATLLGTSCIAALWAFLPLFSVLPGLFDSARLHTLLALAAPVAALTVCFLLAFNGYRAGRGRAVAALLLYLVAALYANYVTSAGLIAGQLGYTLAGAIGRIGPEMALALWRAHLGAMEFLLYLVGAGLALLLGAAPWRRP
ncbi:MAG: hypothetical protein MUE46_04435 [Xanthomonadales bacterium]|jgi:hypothetical protein|nr:hypothetical protein [Xanthomonadales bacterium]